MPKQKTLEQFIAEARRVHNNKYEYTTYSKGHEKISIHCNDCNKQFQQTPSQHLQGHGCKYCKAKKLGNLYRKDKNQFIVEAKLIHGKKYGYDKIVYVKNSITVLIFCKTCNNYFEQTPDSHLSGHGCQSCSDKKSKRSSTDLFIKTALTIHENRYDYSAVNYVKSSLSVVIKCNNCGKTFNQTPNNHLAGHGCLSCSRKEGGLKRRSSAKITE